MKVECTRRILVPFGCRAMREEIGCYATWYNQHRPHQPLDGLTPAEAHSGETRRAVSFETRSR